MNKLFLILLVAFLPSWAVSQNLDVEGQAKISMMPSDPTAQSFVVKQGDGTLAIRDISTMGELPPAPNSGEMVYWDGTAWIIVPLGADGEILTLCSGIPTWTIGGACPSCDDGLLNNGETEIDCGGPNCAPCPVLCTTTPTAIVDVVNPTTGKTWMDRNLGAIQVATSSTDVDSYGDLYQWGRGTDGHQCRTSAPTTTLSSTDQPGHGDYILNATQPKDWRDPKNDNLWQGVNGVNNPCPSGYRVPTLAEWDEERLSWSVNTIVGAFNSPLKLPAAGNRISDDGSFNFPGVYGFYWTSTAHFDIARRLSFASSNAQLGTANRGAGHTVRCIKD